jgi:replication initiation and membrane attachment protein
MSQAEGLFSSLRFVAFCDKMEYRYFRTDGVEANVRITNLLHFTEHHRFYVYRDFALSVLDRSVLTRMYQPIVGLAAISLYETLYRQVAADRTGYSEMELHRRLLLMTGLEGEAGRKEWLELTTRLEAIGLLRTSRKYLMKRDENVFEYRLSPPLTAAEFFRNQHMTLLLRDKIGKYMVLALREELVSAEPAELQEEHSSEDLSMPFYELFQLNSYAYDPELEEGFQQTAAARGTEARQEAPKGFDYAEINMRFPRSSPNRPYIENLRFEPEQLASINFVVAKYRLGLAEICRLLDEDGVFYEDGRLNIDKLQYAANQEYLQGKHHEQERTLQLAKAQKARLEGGAQERREEQGVQMEYYLEVPEKLQGTMNVHQYNFVLRNQPYTDVAQMYFPKGPVPTGVLDTLGIINVTYKLNEEVLNVLLHYTHIANRSWSKSSLEQVASDMLGEHIDTYEQAVQFVRRRMKLKSKLEAKERAAEESGGRGSAIGRGGSVQGGRRDGSQTETANSGSGKRSRGECERRTARANPLEGEAAGREAE